MLQYVLQGHARQGTDADIEHSCTSEHCLFRHDCLGMQYCNMHATAGEGLLTQCVTQLHTSLALHFKATGQHTKQFPAKHSLHCCNPPLHSQCEASAKVRTHALGVPQHCHTLHQGQ